jgi:hypothetical protein
MLRLDARAHRRDRRRARAHRRLKAPSFEWGGRGLTFVLHLPGLRLIFADRMSLTRVSESPVEGRFNPMKTMLLLLVAAALVAPVAAFADGAPTPASTANKICKTAQAAMGAKLFSQTYGANAFGKCVAKNASAAKADVTNAAKTCKAQQADVNFAASHDGKTFDQFYGGNASKGKGADANAYGKCVSQAVSASVAAQVKATTAAAKTCKAALKANAASFASTYGSDRNAFGKCVATVSKTK